MALSTYEHGHLPALSFMNHSLPPPSLFGNSRARLKNRLSSNALCAFVSAFFHVSHFPETIKFVEVGIAMKVKLKGVTSLQVCPSSPEVFIVIRCVSFSKSNFKKSCIFNTSALPEDVNEFLTVGEIHQHEHSEKKHRV